jgi:hypothetical protein
MKTLKYIFWKIKALYLLSRPMPKPSKKLIRLLEYELDREKNLILSDPNNNIINNYLSIKNLLNIYNQ